MNDETLFRVRVALVQAFLRENQCDGVLISRADNFAMATGGKRNYVSTATDLGMCSLFVAKDGRAFFVGNNIEQTRVMAEELGPLGCDARTFPWFEGAPAGLVRKEFSGALVSDDGTIGENVHGKLAYLRALLTPDELEKYRRLGQLAAEAMTAAVHSVRAGDSEGDIAARIVSEGAKRHCHVPVVLVAADDRIARYRHPLPTVPPLLGDANDVCVRGYAMLVGSFLREGLVVSITRFKQVGPIDETLPAAHARICGVDAILQEASCPCQTLGDVFAACQRAYAGLGFPADEWHNHHQGGTTGYAGRTCKATPGEPFLILDTRWAKWVRDIAGVDVEFGHAFAWNPSAVGVKSEDTFILLPDGSQEIVTRTPALPMVDLAAVLGRETSVAKSGIAT